jgi:type I restriction enzyme S subunit
LPGFSGGWLVINLGHVATFLKGKGLPKSALTSDGVDSCIHYGELFTHYAEIVGEITSRTNGTRDSFRSVANDVLMPTSDVTPRGLAKASCVTLNNVILGGDILVIRSDPSRVFGAFLSYVIRREEDQVLRLVTGSTVYHLYGSDMKKFKFALPSVPEQIAISTLLSEMDVELTTLESRLAKTRDLKQGMMQELLTGRIRLA